MDLPLRFEEPTNSREVFDQGNARLILTLVFFNNPPNDDCFTTLDHQRGTDGQEW